MDPSPSAGHQEELGERRGLFSCLLSKCDAPPFNESNLDADLLELLLDLHEEAFRRLPAHDMPVEAADQLAVSMREGGLCLGLLDPVTNIILNTVALLPRDFGDMAKPDRRRSKRLAAGRVQPSDYSSWNTSWVLPSSGRVTCGPSTRRATWYSIAGASRQALIRFMVAYFGCLSEEQATRYLHWARADLALAVQLVEHDLHAAAVSPPDPASQRTQAAFKYAASCGRRHPAPDDLVRLQASPLPKQCLCDSAPLLDKGGRKLTVDDVITIMDLLRYQDGAPLDLQFSLRPSGRELLVYCRDLKADEGRLDISNTTGSHGFKMFTIKVERHGHHFAALRSPHEHRSMISSCLHKVVKTAKAHFGSAVMICSGDACEYTRSLRMRLHDMIHGFYLKVFAMLPSMWLHLIPHILFAGHCYGPMDPVSNIIINSICHHILCPLPSSADCKVDVYDILDTLSMLRVEVRSLEGLIALVRASSESQCSTQRAMEHLSCKRCDLSQETHTSLQFTDAAAAARHPQHAELGSFFASLAPDRLIDLRLLLATSADGRISSESLGEIISTLKHSALLLVAPVSPNAAELCNEAKETLLQKRSCYNEMKLFIRAELAQVLKKYAFDHPLEPKYEPSFICGLVAAPRSLDRLSYHVNFVAASESDNQLFFAEINEPFPDPPKPSFCCPLPLTSTGRCYYGEGSARKIVYPDSSELLECNIDITDYGTVHADGLLDPDFILDFRRDAQFAEDLRKYCEEQKADEYELI
ncbi:unnamed protein product [Triticum turgidum subsp. durum]|uniref:Uncharacterized protein n=1 Tax=Triticum turgidum subsp. durum TaxID=4567 RepID=A0A9R1AFW8_TRITD|nr:unnamed protein product [Triticum turgidum subsp. durum]